MALPAWPVLCRLPEKRGQEEGGKKRDCPGVRPCPSSFLSTNLLCLCPSRLSPPGKTAQSCCSTHQFPFSLWKVVQPFAEHIERNWLSLIFTSRSELRNIFRMDTSSKENIQLFCKNSMQPIGGTSFKTEYSSSKKKQPCCGELKVFLSALSFVYFAKALAGGYLKSTITQIERRFEIPSSLVGIIDGSFEIGRYYRCPISHLNTTSSKYY